MDCCPSDNKILQKVYCDIAIDRLKKDANIYQGRS